ncbi:hypothetical protein ACH40F_55925 [Streptomyces sp. NPDC020794]|uniref:hypothetical protein n=1 Tax=unclassified Streptomyces TaxID=2593676 RepID=UPI0036E71592
MDPELLERITARRAELDELEEQLAKQLAEVRAERDELAVAERVLERVSEQLADERASAAPMPGQVGGRSVKLIPHREPDLEETMLPPDYQRIPPLCGRLPDPSWPGMSARCWESTSACGPSWNRCAGDWSDSLIAAGCANCPTAGSPPACDRGCCRPEQSGASAPLARRADRPARSPGTVPGPRLEEGR